VEATHAAQEVDSVNDKTPVLGAGTNLHEDERGQSPRAEDPLLEEGLTHLVRMSPAAPPNSPIRRKLNGWRQDNASSVGRLVITAGIVLPNEQ
jgi:hypothetical protein